MSQKKIKITIRVYLKDGRTEVFKNGKIDIYENKGGIRRIYVEGKNMCCDYPSEHVEKVTYQRGVKQEREYHMVYKKEIDW